MQYTLSRENNYIGWIWVTSQVDSRGWLKHSLFIIIINSANFSFPNRPWKQKRKQKQFSIKYIVIVLTWRAEKKYQIYNAIDL